MKGKKMIFLKILPIIAIVLLAACKSTVPQTESLLDEHVSMVQESISSSVELSLQNECPEIEIPSWNIEDIEHNGLPQTKCELWQGCMYCWDPVNEDELKKDSVIRLRLTKQSLTEAIHYALDRDDDVNYCGVNRFVSECKVQLNDNKLQMNVLSENKRLQTSMTITNGVATVQEEFTSDFKETIFAEICNFHKNNPKASHVECLDKTIIYTMKEKFIIDDMNVLDSEFQDVCRWWLREECYACEN
jgi:hypothetical protein